MNVEAASGGSYSRSDSPDGERVEKGGVAQLLRRTLFRQLGYAHRLHVPRQDCGSDVDLEHGETTASARANTSLTPSLFGFGVADNCEARPADQLGSRR